MQAFIQHFEIEDLPDYSPHEGDLPLPNYEYSSKQFYIQSKFSFSLGIYKKAWKLIEQGSNLTWFNLYPSKTGVVVKEDNKLELMKSVLTPSTGSPLKYNFDFTSSEVNSCLEVLPSDAGFYFKITLKVPYLKWLDTKVYYIKRSKSNLGASSVWYLTSEEMPSQVLAKFRMLQSSSRLAEISFNSSLESCLFHLFIGAIGQAITHLLTCPSLYLM